MKIVADNKIPFLEGVLEPFAEMVYLPGGKIDQAVVKNADAIITRTRTKCNQQLLEGSSVKFIASATIGYDHIDTDYCRQNGIIWTNAPGCNSGSVQQYLASALLNLMQKYELDFHEIKLGIVGVGNVGTKIKKLADVLGIKSLLNDPPRARLESIDYFVSLDQILAQCNIITLHVPLNMEGKDKTFHLFDHDTIARLHQDCILINSSRGEVIDNQELKLALEAKRIRAAVLDVWENEPDLDLELMNLVDYGTPHIAGYSLDGKANGTAQAVRAVSHFFKLGIDNFYPPEVPEPDHTVIEPIETSGVDLWKKLINCTYDIRDDHHRLMISPETFEEQRGNYPLRREFGVYKVKDSLTNEVKHQLSQLGFQIEK